MATLSTEEYNRLLKQIQDAQKQVDALKKNQVTKPLPSAQKLNSAQLGGSSGVGFETPDSQTNISKEVKKKSEIGIPKSGAGDKAPTTFSRSQADFALRGAGLGGLLDSNKFVGLPPDEARKKIAEEKSQKNRSS